MGKCRISQYLSNRLGQIIFTFGFARTSEGVVRFVVDMDYVASDDLANLFRLGIVHEVHFTYAVQLVQHITILLSMFGLTLDDVCDSWARVVCGDRRAGVNLQYSSH